MDSNSISLFDGLQSVQKQELAAAGRVRKIARGQMLFLQGTPVNSFFVIKSGIIQLFRANADGQEKTIEILKSGQTICESEIMDACRTHRLNAVAVDDCELLEFSVSWLKQNARQYPDMALNLLSVISAQAHAAELEAEHKATMSATQMVACFLQRLCVLYDFDPKSFELPYSKTLIASRLGMQLETLSRTFPKLKECGIIVSGNNVSIVDSEAIQNNVCSHCSIEGECSTHKQVTNKL